MDQLGRSGQRPGLGLIEPRLLLVGLGRLKFGLGRFDRGEQLGQPGLEAGELAVAAALRLVRWPVALRGPRPGLPAWRCELRVRPSRRRACPARRGPRPAWWSPRAKPARPRRVSLWRWPRPRAIAAADGRRNLPPGGAALRRQARATCPRPRRYAPPRGQDRAMPAPAASRARPGAPWRALPRVRARRAPRSSDAAPPRARPPRRATAGASRQPRACWRSASPSALVSCATAARASWNEASSCSTWAQAPTQ